MANPPTCPLDIPCEPHRDAGKAPELREGGLRRCGGAAPRRGRGRGPFRFAASSRRPPGRLGDLALERARAAGRRRGEAADAAKAGRTRGRHPTSSWPHCHRGGPRAVLGPPRARVRANFGNFRVEKQLEPDIIRDQLIMRLPPGLGFGGLGPGLLVSGNRPGG